MSFRAPPFKAGDRVICITDKKQTIMTVSKYSLARGYWASTTLYVYICVPFGIFLETALRRAPADALIADLARDDGLPLPNFPLADMRFTYDQYTGKNTPDSAYSPRARRDKSAK